MDFQHLSNFELRQICYFIAVVQAGNNFSQAANHLGIKQPPLSPHSGCRINPVNLCCLAARRFIYRPTEILECASEYSALEMVTGLL
jgi:hypothetical protein